MSNEINPEKPGLRSQMRELLGALDEERRHDGSISACSRLLGIEAFKHATVVMLYMPLATEIDVTPAALRCFQSSKTVCVPKVDWERCDMAPIEVSSFDDHVMDIDPRGLRMPREGRLIVPSMIDIVIVPALAYDLRGRRLGRGGGYYDRFLGRLRRTATTVGIGFDEQIIDEVPVDDGDLSVDVVLTDRRIARVKGRSKRR
jgi:5-formyltetrahydrofolate cyclo-ligase